MRTPTGLTLSREFPTKTSQGTGIHCSPRRSSMAMTPESKVKKKIVEQLKELGCYYFFPATGGYGKSGVPDIVGWNRVRNQ